VLFRSLDYGTDEAGRPYLAMELLRGVELARLLERRGRLPDRKSVV